ncbi:MAG TPA: LacI family DNA-binding transcriptional regulator [Chthoniobacteraceae bacterium]|nr:LacI family DNA-binding transcriptional regulator [Chthoniobacteraceae bacterium]
MRKITQKDIAHEAGVSQALVSMILNGEPDGNRISNERRGKILATAERLGYRPRKKRKVKGRDKLFVFVSSPVQREEGRSPFIHSSLEGFYHRLYEQVHMAALAQGYSTMHYPADKIEELTRWLSEWEVSGIFWNHGSAQLLNWVSPRFPVVQLERALAREVDSCMADQEMLVQLALEHLHERGHRRIGYISKAPVTDYVAVQRRQAFQNASAAMEGVEPACITAGIAGLQENLRSSRPVSAIIAPDLICFKIIQTLSGSGLSCPDDLSLIGIDNFQACDFSSPTLTSVDLNFKDMAGNAFSLLLARINGEESLPKKIFVTPRLIERASVRTLAVPGGKTTRATKARSLIRK